MTMFGALAFALAVQTNTATLETDPGVIVSKMFEKFWFAQSLTGTIVQTTTDGGGTLRITTKVTYQRPGHINVQQDYKGKNGLLLSLVGNGERFAYDPPWNAKGVKVKPRERLIEPAIIERPGQSNINLGIGDMYHAAHVSLMPSTLLDLLIAHKEHLSDFRINVGTVQLAGVVSFEGKQAYRITGVWQAYKGAADVQMRYELLVSREYDPIKFTLVQPIKVNDSKVVNVTTVETADVKIGTTVDLAQFVVR